MVVCAQFTTSTPAIAHQRAVATRVSRRHRETISLLGILILVELAGSSLLISALEWLRHLSGRHSPNSEAVRYLLPILTPVVFVLLLATDLRAPLPTTTTNVGILLVVTFAFAALLLWLLAEVARYRARTRGMHRSNRYSRRQRKVP